jgi:hypothetical protein
LLICTPETSKTRSQSNLRGVGAKTFNSKAFKKTKPLKRHFHFDSEQIKHLTKLLNCAS